MRQIFVIFWWEYVAVKNEYKLILTSWTKKLLLLSILYLQLKNINFTVDFSILFQKMLIHTLRPLN